MAAVRDPQPRADTRRRYLEVWSAHLLPHVGDYELRAITPMAVEDFREQMSRAKVGAPTQRKAPMLLQWARQAAAPRMRVLGRISKRDRQRDALIVSMLVYSGLRLIEDRGCTWAICGAARSSRIACAAHLCRCSYGRAAA